MNEATAEPDAVELQTNQWFNVREPLTLESLRDRVVLLHTVFEHHEVMTKFRGVLHRGHSQTYS